MVRSKPGRLDLRSLVQMTVAQQQSICMYWGPDLALIYNDFYAVHLGGKDASALGQPFHIVWSDVWEGVKPFVDKALSGEGTWSEDFPLTMLRNGYPEETYWTFSYSPLYEDGRVVGLINIALDTTAAVIGRRNQQALQQELLHRAKNNLAVTTAVVSSTLRYATDLDAARATIAARIAALGKAQEMLRDTTSDASVSEIVTAALQAHLDRPERMSISGPDLKIAAQKAIGLSLAIYELATNAVKYGALSSATGHVNVTWDAGADGSFEFTWRESGGPPVSPPQRRRVRFTPDQRIVPSYFAGSAETDYKVDGVSLQAHGDAATCGSRVTGPRDGKEALAMIELYRGSINTWECDEMGHMNVRFYVAKAMEGLAEVAHVVGLGHAFRAERAIDAAAARPAHPVHEGGACGRAVHDDGVRAGGERDVGAAVSADHASGRRAVRGDPDVGGSCGRATRALAFAWTGETRARLEALTDSAPAACAPRSIDLWRGAAGDGDDGGCGCDRCAGDRARRGAAAADGPDGADDAGVLHRARVGFGRAPVAAVARESRTRGRGARRDGEAGRGGAGIPAGVSALAAGGRSLRDQVGARIPEGEDAFLRALADRSGHRAGVVHDGSGGGGAESRDAEDHAGDGGAAGVAAGCAPEGLSV